MHTEYLSLLSIQGQFWVIWCISNFDDLVSTFDLNFQQSYLYCYREVYTLPIFFYLASDQAERQGPWASCCCVEENPLLPYFASLELPVSQHHAWLQDVVHVIALAGLSILHC